MKSNPEPSPAEINTLVALYNAGRYAEAEGQARVLLEQHPDFGFGWKLLGSALQMQGKNALTVLRKAAELMPNEADAHYNLGVALKSSGLPDAAAASYRRAIELKPDHVEAHGELGNALKELGQHDAARVSIRRAAQLKHDFAEEHNKLGLAFLERRQLDDAVNSFRRALQFKPDFARAHNNLGLALLELRQYDDAAASFRNALQLNPDSAEAHSNLGNVLKILGHLEEAVKNCRRAIEIKPNFAEAYNNLGWALEELGQFDDAASNYRRAIELKPNFVMALSNLGHAMRELQQHDGAAECYRRALEIDPNFIEARLGAAELSMESGAMTEAEEMFRSVLKIDPANLEARILIAKANKVKAGDDNLAALKEAQAAAQNGILSIPDKVTIRLHFALGKSFDDIGDYDSAFPHFLAGCKLKRATLKYDANQATQFFDGIMRVFSQETLERLRGGGNPSRLPIFVLGMPRSGTTLTEQIIASHPEVYGAGELDDIIKISQRDITGTGVHFPNNIPALDHAELARWAADYVTGLQQRAPDARHITDKMPGNFPALGLIHLMLPNAKIIHVNRNPVDTCLSCYTNLFGNDNVGYSYDLVELGRYYADYARLMQHWRTVLPAGAFLDVRYEDIVADQENQARRIIDFCELDWNDACIDFQKNKRSIHTASVTQVRQPLYKSSVERWRPYEKFLGPLLDTLGDLVPK